MFYQQSSDNLDPQQIHPKKMILREARFDCDPDFDKHRESWILCQTGSSRGWFSGGKGSSGF